MIKKLDHIGIAVSDLEAEVAFYRDILGLHFLGYEDLPDRQLKVAKFEIGETHLELLFPTSPDSTVAKFIAQKGEGLHHIAMKVDAAQQTLDHLAKSGVQLIDTKPRPGAGNTNVAFLHPKSTFRVLIEICESPCM